jgi:hypothetical protein
MGAAMSETHDQFYYTERQRQCLMLADQARDPNARAAHLQLASLYARRAQSVAEEAGNGFTYRSL